ncbi:hypothetical protein H2203_002333 [Taxawa tesnikishii (nom. ined.)]|nr:hypothetical protein H2203_002333 [Dothideales sp. JES 119]
MSSYGVLSRSAVYVLFACFGVYAQLSTADVADNVKQGMGDESDLSPNVTTFVSTAPTASISWVTYSTTDTDVSEIAHTEDVQTGFDTPTPSFSWITLPTDVTISAPFAHTELGETGFDTPTTPTPSISFTIPPTTKHTLGPVAESARIEVSDNGFVTPSAHIEATQTAIVAPTPHTEVAQPDLNTPSTTEGPVAQPIEVKPTAEPASPGEIRVRARMRQHFKQEDLPTASDAGPETPTPTLPVLPLLNAAVTPTSGVYVVAGQTLTPGGAAITVSNTPISAGTGGGGGGGGVVFVIGSSTIAFATPPQLRPAPRTPPPRSRRSRAAERPHTASGRRPWRPGARSRWAGRRIRFPFPVPECA